MDSSRYTVAIHILTLLAYMNNERLTSDFIAGSVNTNPVVIRRLLSSLLKAGFVSSQGGPGGGWKLLRSPEAISLKDVYRTVESDSLFSMHNKEPNPLCPVGRTMQKILINHFKEAQHALEQDLEHVTIANLVNEVSTLTSG